MPGPPATSPATGSGEYPAIRIDKLLWFLRLAASRSFAQTWASQGHIRVNGRRIARPSASVREGDVLVLPLPDMVRVIELLAIPLRRGPAGEARACYRFVDTHPDPDPPDEEGEPQAGLTGAPRRL